MSILKFLTTCLGSISLIIVTSCSFQKSLGFATPVNYGQDTLSVLKYDNNAIQLKSEIAFRNAQISGITIVKLLGDTVKGVFVNEFGIRGFEFVILNGDCRITNVMNKMNKWYIKQILSDDLGFIFSFFYTANNKNEILVHNRNKTMRYLLFNGQITKVSKIENKKVVAELKIENDSIFLAENLIHKLKYKFQIIKK